MHVQTEQIVSHHWTAAAFFLESRHRQPGVGADAAISDTSILFMLWNCLGCVKSIRRQYIYIYIMHEGNRLMEILA